VFFAFEPEFNLSTKRACVANAAQQSANDNINAYRKVHNLFREEGVTNVAFVWAPSMVSSPATTANASNKYYPGDAYVDWVGMTIYIHEAWRNAQGNGLDTKFAAAMASAGSSKPMFILGLGVADPTTSGYNKVTALEHFFDDVELKYPTVKGLIYYNIDVNSNFAYKLEHDDAVMNVWQDRTAHDRYVVSGIGL
jgi:hypothetical protein